MSAITTHNITTSVISVPEKRDSLLQKFMAFCSGQEENRLLWLGASLTIHGCVLTPLSVIAVVLAGTNFFLLMSVLIAMGITVVTNLAAMPTKVTIPAFVLSVMIDLIVLISCVLAGFDIAQTYI